MCVPGATGRDCETLTDPCLSGPCLFGGMCHQDVGGYTCSCVEGFIGDRCEAVVRSCNKDPCGQNALCVDNPTGGSVKGYHGDGSGGDGYSLQVG